jgi:hypothetical protein
MPLTIAWIIAVCLGVIGLTIAFIINAKALKRDLDQRRDAFRTSLENAANAVVGDLLKANGDDGRQTESTSYHK